MVRRLSVIGASAAFFVVLALQAQPPVPDASTRPKSTSPDNIVREEDRLAREYKQFTGILLRLAQRLDKSSNPDDKAKAEGIRKAINLNNEQAVENRFQRLITTLISSRTLTVDDLQKAAEQSEELIKILREMLDLLLTDSEVLKRREEIAKLTELIKQVENIIKSEKVTQARIEGNKVGEKSLEKEQKNITEKTESVARSIGAGKENQKSDGKEGEAKGDKGDAGKADPKDDHKGPKGDPKEAKTGDKKDSTGKQDPAESKGKPGNSKDAADSKSKPKDGSDAAGESKKGDPKSQQTKDAKPAESKAKPDNKADAKGSGESKDGKPSDAQASQSKPSQSGQQNQAQSKPNDGQKNQNQQANNQQQQPNPASEQAKKQIQDAIENQKKAEDDLRKPDRDKAAEDVAKAIDKLEELKKELEKRLKQLREEELERLLANLQSRCERMLAMQIEVYEGTKRVYGVVQTYPDKKATRAEEQRAQQLSTREGEIVKLANSTLQLLESEGSAVAFYGVMESVRDDMINVEKRLDKYDVSQFTQRIEEDIIAQLKDMIEALKKKQQEMKDQKNNPSQQNQGQPPPQRLLDLLAELKLIRSMQMQVNKRTRDYGATYQGEQADEPQIQNEIQGLSKRQTKLEDMLKNIASGKNQ